MLQMGHLSQMVIITGWVAHDLTVSVNQQKQDEYSMKFNFRTYDNEGVAVFVPCWAFGDIAFNLYNELQKNDSLTIWGQLRHFYNPKLKEPMIYIKVLSYSIVIEVSRDLEIPELSEEKATFLKKMSDIFDESAPVPSNEMIAEWRKVWQQNQIKRNRKYKK